MKFILVGALMMFLSGCSSIENLLGIGGGDSDDGSARNPRFFAARFRSDADPDNIVRFRNQQGSYIEGTYHVGGSTYTLVGTINDATVTANVTKPGCAETILMVSHYLPDTVNRRIVFDEFTGCGESIPSGTFNIECHYMSGIRNDPTLCQD